MGRVVSRRVLFFFFFFFFFAIHVSTSVKMEDNNVEDDGFVTASANQNQKPVVRRFWKWKPLPERGRFPQQWSFWVEDFNKQNHKSGMSSDQFADGLHKVNDFNDMKQFCFHWSKYTDDQGRPKHNCNLPIFHRGITPVWEDPANIIGGHWVIRILKNERKSEESSFFSFTTCTSSEVTLSSSFLLWASAAV